MSGKSRQNNSAQSKASPKRHAAVTPLAPAQLIPFALCLVIFIIGALSKSYAVWGFGFWGEIPPPFAASALTGSALLLLLTLSPRVAAAVAGLFRPGGAIATSRKALIALLSTFVLVTLFYLFRSRALVYGDGALLLSSVTPGNSGALAGKDYLELLSLASIRFGMSLLVSGVSMKPANALALINCIGGAVAVWGIYLIATNLARSVGRRAVIMLTAAGSATVLLFFGYIENYTWATAIALVSLWLTLEYLDGRKGAVPMLAVSVLAVLFHAITLPFLLVSLAALSIRAGGRMKFFCGLSFVQAIVFFLLGSAVVVLLVQTSGLIPSLEHAFVTLLPREGNRYWFLSPAHLVDMFNLLLLLAPLGLCFVLVSSVVRRREHSDPDPKLQLLGMLAILTVLASFWMEPNLGAPRDWDLLSFPGIPLSILGAYWFTSRAQFHEDSSALVVPTLLVALLALLPNLYEKNHPVMAAERIDRLLWNSPQYQTEYENAARCRPWGVTLLKNMGRDDLAFKYFRRRLSVVVNSPSSWFNLGQIYQKRGQLDSAEFSYDQSLRYEPDNGPALCKDAAIKEKLNKLKEALDLITRAEGALPNDPTVQTVFGVVQYRLQNPSEALRHFRKGYSLLPTDFEMSFNLGYCYYGLAQYDSAVVYLDRARQTDPRQPSSFAPLIESLLSIGRRSDAERVLGLYRQIAPNSDGLRRCEALLASGTGR